MDLNEKGIQTQLRTIEATTGKGFATLRADIESWGDVPYAQRRLHIAEVFGLGAGHADTLGACVDEARRQDERASRGATWRDEARTWFTGGKAKFLPVFEALADEIGTWPGVECAPKKGYVSLRTRKQFATLGPATATRLEVGLNGRHFVAGDRLLQLPAGQICHFQVRLAEGATADAQLLEWIRSAYEASLS